MERGCGCDAARYIWRCVRLCMMPVAGARGSHGPQSRNLALRCPLPEDSDFKVKGSLLKMRSSAASRRHHASCLCLPEHIVTRSNMFFFLFHVSPYCNSKPVAVKATEISDVFASSELISLSVFIFFSSPTLPSWVTVPDFCSAMWL